MRYCTHASKMEQHNMKREIFDLKNTHTVYFIHYIKKIIIPISFAPKNVR